MFRSKTFKKILIGSTALIGVSVLAPAAALAAPCPANITDNALAGIACEFSAGSSITISNAGNVGGISMINYTPAPPSFILNNGTIASTIASAIVISSSALSGGITNNSEIHSSSGAGIVINNSTINGGIANTGAINSFGDGIDIEDSAVNDDINNSGTITANSIGIRVHASMIGGSIVNSGTITGGGVDDGIAIFGSSEVTGAIINHGTIQVTGNGDGLFISDSAIDVGIVNTGTISGGFDGVAIRDVSTVQNNFDNTGTIMGAHDGIVVRSASTINGAILNEGGGVIHGGEVGIVVSSADVNGGIQNAGVIQGGSTGIAVSNTSLLSTGIQNHGIIEGGVYAIHIPAGSTVPSIDLFSGGSIIGGSFGAIDAPNTDLNIHGGQIIGSSIVNVANIEGDFTTHGDIAAGGGVNVASGDTLTLRAGDSLIANVAGTGGTLAIGVGSVLRGFIAGTLDLTNLTPAVDVEKDALLHDGDQYTIAGAIAGGPGGTFAIADNSYLWNFDLITGSAAIRVVQASASSLGLDEADTHTLGVLQVFEANNTTNTQILGVLGNLNGTGSRAGVQDILQSAEPTLNGSDLIAAQTIDGETLDITGQQLALLRDGDETGMAAGQSVQGVRAWGQVFGSHSNQDERDGIKGYSANSWGGVAGIDTQNISDKVVAGLALSYGSTNANSRNSNNTGTDVNSYQLTLYGNYDLARDTFVNGMLAYGWQDVDTTRFDIGGVGGLTARGSFDTSQYAARVEAGKNYAYGSALVTPTVLANYLHYAPGSYTETGAGGADLHVDRQDMDVFELGAGVNVSQTYKESGGIFTPGLHGGYRYDLVGDHLDATNTFAAGGAAFDTQGLQPGRGTLDAGVNLKFAATNNWEFTADYDFQYKQDYTNNAGFLRAAYKF